MSRREGGLALAAWLAGRSPREPGLLLRKARRQRLAATLAYCGSHAPEIAARVLAEARLAEVDRLKLRWNLEQLGADLAPLGCPVIALKGAAYAASGARAARGRMAGDLDVLVPRSWLGAAEVKLAEAGWQTIKDDPYDDHYYRTWMHELPPLVHPRRELILDLHHTILPLTARIHPDMDKLVSRSALSDIPGVRVPATEDMIVHAALHLFHDGDLDGGLRTLWDIDCLLRDGADQARFGARLAQAIAEHGAMRPMFYALRYARRLFNSPVPDVAMTVAASRKPNVLLLPVMDWLFLNRLSDIDWAERTLTGRVSAVLLYLRSHWLRMPPMLLARHLATKAWRRLRAHRDA